MKKDYTFGLHVGQLVTSRYEQQRFIYRITGIERRFLYPERRRKRCEINARVQLLGLLRPDFTPVRDPGLTVYYDAAHIEPFTRAYIDMEIQHLCDRIAAYNRARVLVQE